jgi:transcriptional regulator with XRE-family HTH domain
MGTVAVTRSGIRGDVPDAVRPWAEQLRALADATGLRSQAQLAAALHVGTATMSRYLSAERLPDRSTVDKLVELARDQHGSVDETALFGAYEAAEKYFADRRSRGRDTASANTPTEDVPRVQRTRVPILVRFGIAAVVAAAAVGVAIVSASPADEPQNPQPQASTTCSGKSCAGKNHNVQGCDEDARSLAGRDNAPTIIEVMYSNTCQAAWAKAKGAPPGSVIKITDDNGHGHRAQAKAAADNAAPKPTRMVSAPVGTRLTACVITETQRICTETIEVGAS